jgi:hypothetical protein
LRFAARWPQPPRLLRPMHAGPSAHYWNEVLQFFTDKYKWNLVVKLLVDHYIWKEIIIYVFCWCVR